MSGERHAATATQQGAWCGGAECGGAEWGDAQRGVWGIQQCEVHDVTGTHQHNCQSPHLQNTHHCRCNRDHQRRLEPVQASQHTRHWCRRGWRCKHRCLHNGIIPTAPLATQGCIVHGEKRCNEVAGGVQQMQRMGVQWRREQHERRETCSNRYTARCLVWRC